MIPGVAVCVLLALVATGLGRLVPFVGGAVFGIVLGIAVGLSLPLSTRARLVPGVRFCARTVLQTAIVLLGATLDFSEIGRVSAGSLPVMLGTLGICLAAAWLIGRALRLDGVMRTLIGVGTGICGASAIAAVSPVIGAGESEIAYAISTIFLYNVAAVLLFPPLGHLLGFSQTVFGTFAGTAINDTSSVVAAGYAYGQTALDQAVVVKLTRTVLIVPIVLGLALARHREPGARGARWWRALPLFLVWFVVASLLDTLGVVPAPLHPALSLTAAFLIVVALCGVGLSTDLAAMRRAGTRPLLLGAILWAIVTASSVAILSAGGGAGR